LQNTVGHDANWPRDNATYREILQPTVFLRLLKFRLSIHPPSSLTHTYSISMQLLHGKNGDCSKMRTSSFCPRGQKTVCKGFPIFCQSPTFDFLGSSSWVLGCNHKILNNCCACPLAGRATRDPRYSWAFILWHNSTPLCWWSWGNCSTSIVHVQYIQWHEWFTNRIYSGFEGLGRIIDIWGLYFSCQSLVLNSVDPIQNRVNPKLIFNQSASSPPTFQSSPEPNSPNIAFTAELSILF
jgi:hypothetical protein